MGTPPLIGDTQVQFMINSAVEGTSCSVLPSAVEPGILKVTVIVPRVGLLLMISSLLMNLCLLYSFGSGRPAK